MNEEQIKEVMSLMGKKGGANNILKHGKDRMKEISALGVAKRRENRLKKASQ